jgi:iron complex outermembrane recepter protein
LISKLLRIFVILTCCTGLAWAARQGNISGKSTISGKAVDASGSAMAGATVSISDLTSGAVVKTSTGADGQFSVSNLTPDRYLVAVEKSGFNTYTEVVSLINQQSVTIQATLTVATLSQSVVVRGTVVPRASPMPTRQDVLLSDQSIRVLDRKQLDAAGPLAGGAQMINYTPIRREPM